MITANFSGVGIFRIFMVDTFDTWLRHDKTNKVSVRPAKTQISLGIRPVWSESSLCTQWVAEDPRFLHADSEDSDQTGQMPRLIRIFAGHTLVLLVLSCHGSFICIQRGYLQVKVLNCKPVCFLGQPILDFDLVCCRFMSWEQWHHH